MRSFLSPRGRLSRRQFGLGFILPVLILAVLLQVMIGPARAISDLYRVAMSVPVVMTMIKRLHDRDHSGWRLLLFPGAAVGWVIVAGGLVAILGGYGALGEGLPAWVYIPASLLLCWFWVELLVLPGTPRPNRFGPDPLARPEAPSV